MNSKTAKPGLEIGELGIVNMKTWKRLLSEVARRKHMRRTKAEVEAFLERSADWQMEEVAQECLLRAKERSRALLGEIDSYNGSPEAAKAQAQRCGMIYHHCGFYPHEFYP